LHFIAASIAENPWFRSDRFRCDDLEAGVRLCAAASPLDRKQRVFADQRDALRAVRGPQPS
jgi:hypothetical protein